MTQVTTDIREQVRQINEDVYGKGNVDLVEELYHEDFFNHTAQEGIPPDRDGEKAFVQAVHAAMSDTEATMDRIVIDGDKVAWRWTMRGKHTGEFMGVPASGNRVEITGNDIGVFRDGKLAELWNEVDMYDVMVQLGAIDPPAG
jgi:steroid delta-isomerase-like uncharacterized protein